MNMQYKLYLFLGAICLLGGCRNKNVREADFNVIPKPQQVELTADPKGAFLLSPSTQIVYPGDNKKMEANARFLAGYVEDVTGYELPVLADKGTNKQNTISLQVRPEESNNSEGYQIRITADQIAITSSSEAGVFYGIQTLRKAFPATLAANTDILVPGAVVTDSPRFPYRGMMLDVSRHFFSVEFIKRYIDLLALHQVNTFHWHLTDDQGWRIEIKKYPRLTETGSVRHKTLVGHQTKETVYDETPYGGFYTQEQIKEIVAYAQQRYITVVPEIDMPGHMLAALASYPELGCEGGPYEVATKWGIFPDVLCMGNEKTIQFIEDVLQEVVALFPSPYIHIGGDESPRDRWKTCPKCQAKIKELNLKNDAHHSAEDRLQNYCTTRAEKFLNAHGRKLIGWDEILEGELAPNAVIMSWRGMAGGIEAAKMGHEVIMTPTSNAYFDYFQTDDVTNEPLGIGGYLPVKRVYELEPAPDDLTDTQKRFIIGAQANLWTEYIGDERHVEYMTLPRLAAMAEVQWCTPQNKNYDDFCRRLPKLIALYERADFKVAKHVFNINLQVEQVKQQGAHRVTMTTIDDAPLFYTLDGTEPTSASERYTGPLMITKDTRLQAVAIRNAGKSDLACENFFFSKSTMKPIALKYYPCGRYSFEGPATLVDGLKGNQSFDSGKWLGFIDEDLEAVIDLEQPAECRSVVATTLLDLPSWIMGAHSLSVAVSDDNKIFRPVKSFTLPENPDIWRKEIEEVRVDFEPENARYIKVNINRMPRLPKGHLGEGRKPLLFVDEISVY